MNTKLIYFLETIFWEWNPKRFKWIKLKWGDNYLKNKSILKCSLSDGTTKLFRTSKKK